MKSLYESILDDEEVIIDKAKEENNNRWNFIYSLLKYKEADRCVKRLNDTDFKLAKNGRWIKLKPIWRDSCEIAFEAPGANYTYLRVYTVFKTLFVSFPKPRTKKGFIEDLRDHYDTNESDYKKFKEFIIKELDLIPAKEMAGDQWKSKKYTD
jgi:hypothetical protein